MNLAGEKIRLRAMTGEDTERIVSWRNNPRVMKNFIYQKPFTKEGHENWIRTMVDTGKVVQFILEEAAGGRPVGSVYFRDIDRISKKAEYGIFIGEDDAVGKGFGSEAAVFALRYAFEELGLHKVFLRVFADNGAAVRSYEKAGFVQEGYFKDEEWVGERYRDLIFMAVFNPSERGENSKVSHRKRENR